MRIFVKVKTKSKENKVIQPTFGLFEIGDNPVYTVFTKELPERGRANDSVIQILSQHFSVSAYSVRLVSGAVSRNKVFEIDIK